MGELFRRKLSGSKADEVGFFVTRGIPPGIYGIFRLQKNPIMFIHQHGPKRMIAIFAGAPGD